MAERPPAPREDGPFRDSGGATGPQRGPDRARPGGPRGIPLPASTEGWLVIVIVVIAAALGLATDTFLTIVNLFDLLNISAINLIFAAGLLVVLVAGGIDISFAVGASVVQYLTALAVMSLGGGAGRPASCWPWPSASRSERSTRCSSTISGSSRSW